MTPRLPVALDTETCLISETAPLPDVVSLAYALPDGELPALVHRPEVPATAAALLAEDATIIGHNLPYDFGVMAKQEPALMAQIFRAYDEGRVSDTAIREMLLSIEDGTFEFRFRSKGGFSLERLARERLGYELDKSEDSWRLRYGDLIDVPIALWPEEAKNYATSDAASTLGVHQAQERQMAAGYRPPDELLQCRAAWALKLTAAHGVVTDEEAVDRLELSLLERLEALQGQLVHAGVVKKDGSRTMSVIRDRVEAAYRQLGFAAPRTAPSAPREDGSPGKFPNGQIQTDEETIDMVKHIDPVLTAVADYAAIQKDLSFAEIMRRGTHTPIFHDYWPCLETGRTSDRGMEITGPDGKKRKLGTNFQQIPRAPGARECVMARPGNVLVLVDYEIAELRALAQVCYSWFGWSHFRDAIIAGRDPHVQLASSLIGISYEEGAARKKAGEPELKMFRDDVAKHMNFGLAGGMGANTFCAWVRGASDLRLHETDRVMYKGREVPSAKELKEAWLQQWPEMRLYFRRMAEIASEFGPRSIEQFGSRRVRGNVGFTHAANGFFQGYIADIAKAALYLVVRACYAEPSSPLYGCRPILFVHDEIILEAPEEIAHEAATECQRIMVEVEGEWMPDIPPAAEAKIARRWSKRAKPVRDRHNRLIPWVPAA